MTNERTLERHKSALLIVDMQEAFRTAISDFAEKANRIAVMARGAQLLQIPILLTEQYPKGLGRTAPEITEVIPRVAPVEKSAFSSCGARAFNDQLESLNVRQVIVCGIEAHICVNQTVHDLLAGDYQVHILSDCITSRSPADKLVAFSKMQQSGAVPACTEMALFELMRDAGHEQFRAIQKLIK